MITGGRSSGCEELIFIIILISFFYFYVNVQQNVTYMANIYYYIRTEFEYAKRDSSLAAYGGVVSLGHLWCDHTKTFYSL